jgi:peptidoglycan/LPS O-acetylase OafA/YrhL
LPQTVARGTAAAAVVLYVLFMASGWNDDVAAFGRDAAGLVVPFPLRFSQWFLADHVVGVLTMALVWALCSANLAFSPLVTALGTGLAKVSFSLYVVHFPLLQFFGALMPGYGPVAVAVTFGVALAFGAVFEPQRERLRWILTALPYPRLL